MKFLKLTVLAFLSAGFFACGGSESTDTTNDSAVPEETPEETSEMEYRTLSSNSYFDVDIPSNMTIMSDLNPEASLGYGYVAQVGSEVKEHYMIVLMETHEEIESYDLDMDFDVMSYSESSIESITAGLDTYEILSGEPKVEKINGMDCIVTEMDGSLGEVNVFYKLGVFEGEKAFYQVLTWTIDNQKAEFMSGMNKIINSFTEK